MKASELKKAFELERKKFKEISESYHEDMIDSFIELSRTILKAPSYSGTKLGIINITAIGLIPKSSFLALKIFFELKTETEILNQEFEIEPKRKHLILNTPKKSVLQKNMYEHFISLFSDYISQESMSINQALYEKVINNTKENAKYEFLIKKQFLENSIQSSMGNVWYSQYEKKQLEQNTNRQNLVDKSKKVKL